MSVKKVLQLLFLISIIGFFPCVTRSASLTEDSIAKQLGWIASNENQCGGYYLEPPFVYLKKNNLVEITSSKPSLFSQYGTSILGDITLSRYGQEITATKAYLYRDPTTGKISTVELIGNVKLREPGSLVLGKKGRFNFKTQAKSFSDILYRASLNGKQITHPPVIQQDLSSERKVTSLTAWGKAHEFSQSEPRIYELTQASYSTCPPKKPSWQVKADHIVLNKNTGRGYATDARLLVKGLPVFYSPYINFPIDTRRKTGFLWPTFSAHGKWGPALLAPFYWDMAPNYDMTITPGFLSKRGVLLSDEFRYLTNTNSGNVNFSILPNDRALSAFQTAAPGKAEAGEYGPPGDPTVQANLNRLLSANTTRKSFYWRDDTTFDPYWSSHIDYNYASDDYYLQDFGSNLNEITQNQLLQEGDIYYKGPNWNFTGRIQAYQTLHPINVTPPVENQYRRLPQLILEGDYPDQPFGLEYFMNNEFTHFDIRKTPGTTTEPPTSDRFHIQPGISLPLSWPYFYLTPRAQLSATAYQLYNMTDAPMPHSTRRTIPIFDISSGFNFSRDMQWFGEPFQQTLEPQAYYIHVPYRNQASIPTFDTTVNTLTYDQLFSYNRFSGFDRIGDANQMSVGVTTRFIDQQTGFERVRFGVGQIIYFADRRVTLCSDQSCTDNPENPDNQRPFSPLSGVLDYKIDPRWNFTANVIWDPQTQRLDNSTLALHYQPDDRRIINFGYSFAHQGSIFSGIGTNTAENNLRVTDFSFAWPVTQDVSAVGRWSQDWNLNHFQNLLYGLQYDTCCWAVQLVGGRAFTNITPNNTPQYNTQFYVQFVLKGLGNIGSGNPNTLLNTISGYKSDLGQDM